MREPVGESGGTLEAGHAPAGYRVRAVLPAHSPRRTARLAIAGDSGGAFIGIWHLPRPGKLGSVAVG